MLESRALFDPDVMSDNAQLIWRDNSPWSVF